MNTYGLYQKLKKLTRYVKAYLIRNRLLIFALFVSSSLLFYSLFFRPILGLADNGDFYRIMKASNLYYLNENFEDKHFKYFNKNYGIMKYYNEIDLQFKFFTTHLVPIKISIMFNKLFFSTKMFDLRFLAFIYCVFMNTSLFLIVKYSFANKRVQRLALVVAMLIVFFDMGYLVYFNSFYGEAASLVFLLLTLGSFFYLVTGEKLTIPKYLFFIIAVILFIGAKQQNIPLAALFLLLLLRLYFSRSDIKWRITSLISMVAIMAISGLIYFSVSGEIENINKYHAITLGIIKDSPTPEQDLIEIGIDPKFAVLARTTYYERYPLIQPDSKIMTDEFYSNYSFLKIISFYLRHFDRFVEKLSITSKYTFMLKQPQLGTFERVENRPPGDVTMFYSLWSTFKERYIPRNISFLSIFYGIFLIILAINYFKNRKNTTVRLKLEMLLIVALIGAVQFLVSLIGAGEADLSKHLFLFDVCFDIMAIVTFVYFIRPMWKR